MKKAFTWLQAKGIPYTFHDYKIEGVSKSKLSEWMKHLDLWQVLNTKSTTWKEIPDEQKATIQTKEAAIALLMGHTSMIKRPLVETPNGYLLGFKPEEWETVLKK